jgi:hypothetical protein
MPSIPRKTASDYHALAHSRNLQWIGNDIPQSTKQRTYWRCEHGHEWETSYQSICNSLNGCRKCYDVRVGNRCRDTAEDYHAIADQHGIEWRGNVVPKTNHIKTLWKCSEGHEWEASKLSLQHAEKSGCPECAKLSRNDDRRLTPSDYHELAVMRGYKWVGEEMPRSNQVKTLWQCPIGHIWAAHYGNISTGRSCPTCQDRVNGQYTSKPQRMLHELLGGELNYRIGRSSVDIALFFEGVKIAIEYDGWHWHKDKPDVDKTDKLLALGWNLLRIKSADLIPDRHELERCIQRLCDGERYIELTLKDWGE